MHRGDRALNPPYAILWTITPHTYSSLCYTHTYIHINSDTHTTPVHVCMYASVYAVVNAPSGRRMPVTQWKNRAAF